MVILYLRFILNSNELWLFEGIYSCPTRVVLEFTSDFETESTVNVQFLCCEELVMNFNLRVQLQRRWRREGALLLHTSYTGRVCV